MSSYALTIQGNPALKGDTAPDMEPPSLIAHLTLLMSQTVLQSVIASEIHSAPILGPALDFPGQTGSKRAAIPAYPFDSKPLVLWLAFPLQNMYVCTPGQGVAM